MYVFVDFLKGSTQTNVRCIHMSTNPTITQSLLNSPAGKQWRSIGVKQHHGVDIPLFSIHSGQSCGIGEYTDLIPLITWCKQQGLDVLQLLPLNDTGPDTSPYSAISAFALNPIHLGLERLPHLQKYPELQAQLPGMHSLNNTQRVDYPAVGESKRKFLQEYFLKTFKLIESTTDYQQFVRLNPWLYPYALFKTLKIEHEWYSWELWEDPIRHISPEHYRELLNEKESDINFHIYLQYLCFQQMKTAKNYADQQGVFLKGDIPILINRESADVWFHPELFDLNYSAGGPPDMYSDEGQNWGFPIYNWEAIEKEEYSWWKQRLHVTSALYHLYRIDHIVGFFRIWSIPLRAAGHEGFFIPKDKTTWIPHGTKILEMMLDSCDLLPIGEDLGEVPPKVRVELKSLGICGTKVMRWERMWEEDKRFIKLEDYLPASMTTVSTHDSETLKEWWKNNPEEAQAYSEFKGWEYEPELSLEHHREILYDSHHTASLFHINLLQEYLALVPGMTWPNPEDERINMPGIVSERNWTYRFRPSLEEMLESTELSKVMKETLRSGDMNAL